MRHDDMTAHARVATIKDIIEFAANEQQALELIRAFLNNEITYDELCEII